MPNELPDRAVLNPIPTWVEAPDWQRIPILESGEPLIPVPTGDDANIVARADYANAGMPGALPILYLRSGVVERLLHAAATLKPAGTTLVAFDAYRPLSVQQHLFDTYAADIRAEHPELSEDQVTSQVRRFVAYPSSDPLCPPPHRTGGAVDVYLIDTATGQSLPMGTEPDATADASATRYYENDSDPAIRANRRLLFHAMASAGFTNYHEEWWHYDFGNQRWANVANKPTAIYGAPAEPK